MMRPADALRALSRYAYPATLVSVASAAALPVSPTRPVGHVPTERQASMTSSSAPQGYRGHLRAATSSLAITARVAASSGGPAAPSAQGCAATVLLVVTVRYGPHDAWSRETVLIYDPPPGVHVLTRRTAPTYRVHRVMASVRFPLPRPRHGRTQLRVTLSLRAGPVQGRDRLGRLDREIGAHVGGRLRIMQGPHTLGSAFLRLLVPIRCVTSQPGVHTRPLATSTPTQTSALLPTATPTHQSPLPTATPTRQPPLPTATSTRQPPLPTARPTRQPPLPTDTPVAMATPSPRPTANTPVPQPTATPTAIMPTQTPKPLATATPLALPTATPTRAAMQIRATIQNFAFSANPITIAPGSTVTWTNRDGAPHTVTADDGSWGSGTLRQGGTYSQVFTSPGSYSYYCAIHPSMKGTVVVTP
jgi:plastocyanin